MSGPQVGRAGEVRLSPFGVSMSAEQGMNSIFGRVFRYRPRAERLPEEDFFTEAFAGVLESSLSLRAAFAQWLIGDDVDLDSVQVETQKTVDSDRFDVWMDARHRASASRHVIVMENKIGAGGTLDQLRRYEEHLRTEADASTRTLVYATRHARLDFQPCPDGPGVAYRPVRWFEVADWLRERAGKRGESVNERSDFLIRELLLLMEDWSMAMNLTADDLAVAARYQKTVQWQLLQLLDETKGACDLPGSRGNAWSHTRADLCYSSPWVDEHEDVYVEFGFDVGRDDAVWSVPELCLPSAYFAVLGTHRPELDNLADWGPAPEAWSKDCLRVKQLRSLEVHGNSLHSSYLEFFLASRDELWTALGRG